MAYQPPLTAPAGFLYDPDVLRLRLNCRPDHRPWGRRIVAGGLLFFLAKGIAWLVLAALAAAAL
jgi:hypothetical protein